mgnify:CR=1 FL=1
MDKTFGQKLQELRRSAGLSQRDLAEDLAWARLYRVVHQPSAAAEVVKYMDSNPEAKSRNEALYLLARQALHTKALADEQNERTVAFFRAIFAESKRMHLAGFRARGK